MASPADTPAPVGDAARERRRRAAALGPLEAVWRRERRGRSRVFGPFYRSGFLRAFLAGRLEDGAELGVACGTHSRYYPYFHHRSRWDDLLLVAGEERLRVTARNLSTLSISLGPGRRGSIAFHGLAFRRSGASVDVDLHLELEVTLLPPRVEGLGYRFAVAGLQWHPALVHGSGSLTLRGERRPIVLASGLMERGSLRLLRSGLFRFGYDSLIVTRAADPPLAYVRFGAWPLNAGFAGLPLRLLLLGRTAREDVTLSGDRLLPGDHADLAPARHEAEEVLLASRVDVGPAHVVRRLIRLPAGRLMLREHIEPHR